MIRIFFDNARRRRISEKGGILSIFFWILSKDVVFRRMLGRAARICPTFFWWECLAANLE